MHRNLAIISLIAFILLFFTCPLFAQDVYGVVDANNQFAFELYSRYKSNEGNIFFSPYSISSALAMTYEGARGRTADEMQSVFHFPKDEVSRREGFFKIYSKINKKDKEYQLNTANALWAQKNYPFLPEYIKLIENYYGGRVTNLDFSGDAENSRLAINSWVSEKTNNKITDLIPPEFLSSEIRLVLTNAVYFKGFWLEQFDKNDTAEKDFRVRPGNTVKARMMCLTGKEFQYTETEELQILELPYKGYELSMFIILPKNDDLAAAEGSLTPDNLKSWGHSAKHRVDIYLPKFTFATQYFMARDLAEMGMPTAFSGAADFSGMNGKKSLFIDAVIHQAFVDVNEEGTEAAAATAVTMAESIMMPEEVKIFNADHPFIFIIQDRETGNILFLGRVNNPNAA